MKTLLSIDAAVNLLIGVVLLLFPAGMGTLLGLPLTNTFFYTTIMGAVIFGIGVALVVECWGIDREIRGLGLHGAIAINICGAGALLVWLLLEPGDIPVHGRMVLWAVVGIVFIIAIAEIAATPGQLQD